MHPYQAFTKCPITGLPISNYFRDPSARKHFYKIDIEDEPSIKISIPDDYSKWDNDEVYKEDRHLAAGLLLNMKMFGVQEEHDGYAHITLDRIKQHLNEGNLPRTPQEKYDNMLVELFALQEYDGDVIDMYRKTTREIFYKRLYFRSKEEFMFYAQTLYDDEYVKGSFYSEHINQIRITYKGLSHLAGLNKEGSKSKNCFIAMSFGNGMESIRQAIKDACVETGYIPILIDETHYDSDATINDAIIANLKKSRFCIADFTEQKDGVYFESGYALGQGKQVIYSCRNDYFKSSHFDTNHFPHIIYDTPQQLKEALINKINAWIR